MQEVLNHLFNDHGEWTMLIGWLTQPEVRCVVREFLTRPFWALMKKEKIDVE